MGNSFFIVLYGVSGSGKSTLRDAAVRQLSGIKRLVAVTTRPARQGETEGVDKYFITNDEFQKRNSDGELCLANEVYGFMYAFNIKDFKSDDIYICELYHRDFEAFQKATSCTVNIYIKPPSIQKAFEGITRRGSSNDELQRRYNLMQTDYAVLESMSASDFFEYTFANNYDAQSVDEFVKLINEIITKGRYV
ncbi:hypothetical protein LJC34_00240 [Oscillospiraceae bacterium OttesenSCG-928-G22]|nr:hypothetical protein [Oscillospiraceae bacterium OttesenSCG-928-G22]